MSVAGTGLSRVLGAARDIAVAATFGAGAASDAFWVAFTIPNVFRRFVADEGLTGALLPAVSRAEAEEGPEAGHRLANRLLTVLLVANLALVGLGVAFADPLVRMFALAFTEDPQKFALTVSMTRWLMPFLAMVSLVSFAEGLLNHRGHFFVPKLAPGLVSAGIAAGALWVAPGLDEPVWALVGGVLVGGVIHVLVHAPVVARLWGPLGLASPFGAPRLRRVVLELGKVVAIGLFAQVNLIVLRQLAALLGDGAITRYWYANRLVDLSQGVIAVAIGSAILPDLARSVAAADWSSFRADLTRALRLAAFLLVPVAAVLGVFAEPLVAILFRHGAFTHADVLATAAALRWLVPFLLATAGINLLKRVFFALDWRNPLFAVGGVGVATTAGLGWLLVDAMGLSGLTAALSLATTIQLGLYVVVLTRRLGARLGLVDLLRPVAAMGLATVPLAIVLTGAAAVGDWSLGPSDPVNVLLVGGGLGLGGVAYGVSAWALGLGELRRVVDRVRARLGR